MLLFTKCNLHKLDQMHCPLQSVQKLPSIHFQYSRGPHCGALLPTVRAEISTLDTHVTLWLGNGNVDMQLCVCVCQSKITGSVCGPMFSGLVSNVHWWHDVQQCVGPAVYIHTPVYTQCGSPPVSWWRRPAVRGRLLRNRIGAQYWILEEQKGKEKLVSIAIKNWPSARKMN